MEEVQRREMGERIKELRARSPLTQQQAADALDVRLRTWQRYEDNGTTKWEIAEKIAELFGADPHWVWDGQEKGDIGGPPDISRRLSDLESAVTELVDELRADRAVQTAKAARQATQQSRPRQREAPPARRKKAADD